MFCRIGSSYEFILSFAHFYNHASSKNSVKSHCMNSYDILHKIGLVVYDIGLAGPRVLTFIQIGALFVCRNEHCVFWFHLFAFISYKLLLKLKQQQQQKTPKHVDICLRCPTLHWKSCHSIPKRANFSFPRRRGLCVQDRGCCWNDGL